MMKRIALCAALAGCCLLASVHPADAQFWKGWFKKSDQPVRRPPRPANTAKGGSKTVNTTASKKKGPEPLRLAATVQKPRYRIDVLTPLYLNELVAGGKPVYKSHLPDKALPGLSFYQGVKLAADTLEAYGYHLDVYVHDITDPAETVEAMLKTAKLDSSDLIIGAVQGAQVGPLAAYARKRSINFVSALTPADGGVRGNLYFNLLQPSLQRHCEAIREILSHKSRLANIMVYRRNTVAADEQCFKNITHDSAFSYVKVAMGTPMPSANLRNFLDSNKENIIVMPIVDPAYAATLLEQLDKSFPGYRIEVYGMPSWKGIAQLHKEGSLDGIGVTIGAPYYFDPSASAGKGFAEVFTAEFGGKPTEMAYRGYETLYWYANLLTRYGTIFNDHYGDTGAAPFTRFDIKPAVGKDGQTAYYENSHVYFYRYQGGSFSVQQ